jgi:hypothetical protein
MDTEPIIVNISARIGGGGELGASLGARHGCTGREIIANEVCNEVNAWANSEDSRGNAMCDRVIEALCKCPLVVDSDLRFFRGRKPPFRPNIVNPSRQDMGPPPSYKAPEGRYNGLRESVLYLCTVSAAVVRELPDAPVIWIQEFQVPVQSMRIADLRQNVLGADPLLNATMWQAELAGTEGAAPLFFSQLVASLVSLHFDGMLVPGVRGDDTMQYSNLVVFRPVEDWQKWLGPNAPTLSTH